MPSDPETNRQEIEKEARKVLKRLPCSLHAVEEEPIGFGIVGLVLTISWPDDEDPEVLEETLKKLMNVSSVSIVDMRRAVG